jgi:hypothetical protein
LKKILREIFYLFLIQESSNLIEELFGRNKFNSYLKDDGIIEFMKTSTNNTIGCDIKREWLWKIKVY